MRTSTLSLAAAASLAAAHAAQADIVAYTNLTTSATAGYGEVNTNNPVFGDQLTLATGGTLTQLGFSIFNPATGGNTGVIQTGTMNIKIYDNTTP